MRYAGKIHCLSEASLNFSGMVLANFRKLSIPASAAVSENKYFPVLYNGNGFAGGENGKVLDIGRKMQCMGVQEWKITGFGKGVL